METRAKNNYSVYLTKEQYHCPSRTSRILRVTEFNKKGGIVSEDTSPSDWDDVIPDTAAEKMLEALCPSASTIPPMRKGVTTVLGSSDSNETKPLVLVEVDEPPPMPKPSPTPTPKKKGVTTVSGSPTRDN